MADDVLEAVGLQPLEALAHAGAFQLEHADRVGSAPAARRSCVSSSGIFGEIDVDAAAALDQRHGLLQHGQRLEAEEVELHQARRLHQLPVELGDGEARLGIAVERHQLVERPVADHHAGGVRRGVAVEALRASGRSRAGAPPSARCRALPAAWARRRWPAPASPGWPGCWARACTACRPGRRASAARGRRRAARRGPAACRAVMICATRSAPYFFCT